MGKSSNTTQTDRGTVNSAWIAFAAMLLVAVISGCFNLVQNANNRELKIELVSQSAIAAANQNDGAADYSRGVAEGEGNVNATLAQRLSEEYSKGFSQGKENSNATLSQRLTEEFNRGFLEGQAQTIAPVAVTEATILKPASSASLFGGDIHLVTAGAFTINKVEGEDSLGNRYDSSDLATLNSNGAFAQYNVGQKYTKLTGVLAPHKNMSASQSPVFKIYADDKPIYTSPQMSRTTYPIDISVTFPKATKIIKLEMQGYGVLLLVDFKLS